MDRVNQIMNTACAHRRGYQGEGIGVAIMDTGISPHPDFDDRIRGFRDYIGRQSTIYDDNGHGTHVTERQHEKLSMDKQKGVRYACKCVDYR